MDRFQRASKRRAIVWRQQLADDLSSSKVRGKSFVFTFRPARETAPHAVQQRNKGVGGCRRRRVQLIIQLPALICQNHKTDWVVSGVMHVLGLLNFLPALPRLYSSRSSSRRTWWTLWSQVGLRWGRRNNRETKAPSWMDRNDNNIGVERFGLKSFLGVCCCVCM